MEDLIAKILVIHDVHIKAATPTNRLDNYFETTLNKLAYIIDIANNNDYDMILCTGDLFDSPVVSIQTLLLTYNVFKKLEVDFLMPLGNHDIYGYNLHSYKRSSARLLSMLCDKVKVFDTLDCIKYKGVEVSFQPFCAEVDQNGYGYSFDYSLDSAVKIHVVHGMLMKTKPNFEPYTLIKDVDTKADIIISGHDHIGYGIYEREDGKAFINVGSLTRKTAAKSEISRIPKYSELLCFSSGRYALEVHDVEIALPGDVILDRSKIEEKKTKQEIVEEFKEVLKQSAAFGEGLDIESLIKAVSEIENVPDKVIDRALELVEKAKERMNLEEV